jgi:cobalt-zinc-cadmium efflux system membrane fusion protein
MCACCIQARAEESTGLLVPVSAICVTTRTCRLSMSPTRRQLRAAARDLWGIAPETNTTLPLVCKAGDQIVVDGGIFVQFMQNQ